MLASFLIGGRPRWGNGGALSKTHSTTSYTHIGIGLLACGNFSRLNRLTLPLQSVYLPYKDTASFSPLVVDYLGESDNLKDYHTYGQDIKGIAQAIEGRKSRKVDRTTLVQVLREQYAGLEQSEKTAFNIQALGDEKTFTICTAHQPNLMTGYLYFIYKILHAIKLAEVCKEHFPAYNFVPVYYMGSEDNDLDELGTFRYNDEQYSWNADGQTGAVGKMKTDSLAPLLANLYKRLGPPGEHLDKLRLMLEEAYKKQHSIAEATHYLVNELFGQYGLVVLNPDDERLKRNFIPIMQQDLLQHDSLTMVVRHTTSLAEQYKIQAYPRPINLFYLKDEIRERIEENGGVWKVLNTDIRWDKEALLIELNEHPERFSPNVILRPLFQETILPDLVFIGGGAEVAYWLQLKTLFEAHGVFYPSIHLRQSVLWMNSRAERLQQKLGLSDIDIFKQEQDILHDLVLRTGDKAWDCSAEQQAIETIMQTLKKKATDTDSTLRGAAEASLTRIRQQVHTLEKKMLRAEKRKMHDRLNQIATLRGMLFPKGKLQERMDNFLSYYLQYGTGFFDALLERMEPLSRQFLIMKEESTEV